MFGYSGRRAYIPANTGEATLSTRRTEAGEARSMRA